MPVPLNISQALYSIPPGAESPIYGIQNTDEKTGKKEFIVLSNEVNMYCESGSCRGDRLFAPGDPYLSVRVGDPIYRFLEYTCKNCGEAKKKYAVRLSSTKNGSLLVLKLGEDPPFGEKTPTRLLRILGNDRDSFLKGRRSEHQNLGIGAFAYYRRVVESQKDAILDQVISVAEREGTDQSLVDALRNAKKEVQFTKAVDSLRGAFPPQLLIDGRNPLILLHDALSKGLHALSEEECLDRAQAIRIVLSALAERLSELLKDQSALKNAIDKLSSRSVRTSGGEAATR
jgi:hypothetical protein